VADIIYRSEVIKLHIDLLANTRTTRPSLTAAKSRDAALMASPR
jgi:hypothetical protein